MKTIAKLSFILSLGTVPLACNNPPEESDLAWGHLQEDTLNPSTPMYLINKGPNDVYKVCIAQYMAEALPGLEEEIKAAINIWARYLGRVIAVQTTVVPQDRPLAGDTASSLQTKYYKNCETDADVVMGFAPFSGGTVGQTGLSYRGFSSTRIESFKRHLFLRDYQISPDKSGTTRWLSQEELNQKASDNQEILETMLTRNTREIAPKGTAIALQVLVHEFGHVWGLCDQYEGPDNCSSIKEFHSEHKDLNSIMAASSNIAKIYLTDDDITGIRALANRPGFNSQWPGTEDELAQAAQPLNLDELTYFKLNAVQKQGLTFTLNFGLVTARKGGELHIEYRRKGTETWQSSSTFFPSDRPFMILNTSFNLTLRNDGDYEFRLNLRLKGDDGVLMAPIYAML